MCEGVPGLLVLVLVLVLVLLVKEEILQVNLDSIQKGFSDRRAPYPRSSMLQIHRLVMKGGV